MKYPQTLDEFQTLKMIAGGSSIGRFGDGEWRCANGGGCTSQRAHPKLAAELRQVLRESGDGFLVGIPNMAGCPRAESWAKYCAPPYLELLRPGLQYASSFITRPDNAPIIDKPEYWERVRDLWKDKNVILVVGAAKDGIGAEKKSLTTEMLADAKSVQVIIGPRQHAYDEIDAIEAQIMEAAMDLSDTELKTVLLCIGATATALAWRLWKKLFGIHAIDLGHIGMFMRHAGAYRYATADLFSADYAKQLQQLHATTRWGDDGETHADEIRTLIDRFKPSTILDYGCGENTLAKALAPIRVSGYDPGIPELAKMPKPCDLITCTDVLEHVEPEKMDAVLNHIFTLTGKAAYFCIAKRPARAILPDGRNAHLSIHDSEWWMAALARAGFARFETLVDCGKKLTVVALK